MSKAAKGLTDKQKETLERVPYDRWVTARELGVSAVSLCGLHRKGKVDARASSSANKSGVGILQFQRLV